MLTVIEPNYLFSFERCGYTTVAQYMRLARRRHIVGTFCAQSVSYTSISLTILQYFLNIYFLFSYFENFTVMANPNINGQPAVNFQAGRMDPNPQMQANPYQQSLQFQMFAQVVFFFAFFYSKHI